MTTKVVSSNAIAGLHSYNYVDNNHNLKQLLLFGPNIQ